MHGASLWRSSSQIFIAQILFDVSSCCCWQKNWNRERKRTKCSCCIYTRKNLPPKPCVHYSALQPHPGCRNPMQSIGLTRTMVKDGRCRWAGSFLLSPTLLGLGSGRFLCRWVTSCLGLLGFRAGFAATTLRASAAVVQRATGAPLAGLLVWPAFATLVLLVLLTIPHWSRTGWPPGVNAKRVEGGGAVVGKAMLEMYHFILRKKTACVKIKLDSQGRLMLPSRQTRAAIWCWAAIKEKLLNDYCWDLVFGKVQTAKCIILVILFVAALHQRSQRANLGPNLGR